MKVEVIKEEKKAERVYPYIGESESGLVVLFHKERSGILLNEGRTFKKGFYWSSWNEEHFTPLEGKVILQND